MNRPVIAVLGASGLIGYAVASSFLRADVPVLAIARRFARGQQSLFGSSAMECPLVALDTAALARLISDHKAGIVANCVGVLQDGARGSTDDVHVGFVSRLVEAVKEQSGRTLLVHISIPGRENEDRTRFSTSKRKAERLIAVSGVPFVILRPGFVISSAAYGGSALMRALATLPVELPPREARRPFAVTDTADITRTIAWVARRWHAGERDWSATWDVMERSPSTVGGVLATFRNRLGSPGKLVHLPSSLLRLGAWIGDLSAYLGWSPAIRSTALDELRRGVEGNPEPWIAATGFRPASVAEVLDRLDIAVQEKWFARLYLAKPLIIAGLVAFWIVSGLIALIVSFDAAAAILTSRGVPPDIAEAVTLASSVLDIGVGVLIAFRKTCRVGLLSGMGLSALYMIGAAVLTPDLWIEPLGALVKTVPAIVLMLVALAIIDDR